MDSRVCMNGLCGASSSEWRKGWPLRSGDFANLCDKCGSAYEKVIFCDTFHQNDTGWRECTSCRKRLHCGCIASSALIEILDCGGVKCVGCVRSLAMPPALNTEKYKGLSCLTEINDAERGLVCINNKGNGVNDDKMSGKQLNNAEERSDQIKDEITLGPTGESGTMSSPNINIRSSVGVTYKAMNIKDVYESLSLAQTNMTIAPLASPSGNQNLYPGAAVEDLSKVFSSFHHVPRSHHLFSRPPKSIELGETNVGLAPQIRVARPPAEGRVKNQLLPRYWPRITDQELRQISGDSNSTIVPLFEKVLSASDAGRIGRLVLPKACAEAYFPPISQPEGLPLRIQDVKGKEWVFQFRFWPNNNSRMYVLEGVTPCIQSMQLQAGDTVMFSRMDPEGKLLMGFRKASNTMTTQNLPIMSGYSGLAQSSKGSADLNPTVVSKSYGGDMSWQVMEKNGSDMRDVFVPHSVTMDLERKRSQNIGLKSKRLMIDSREALDLKLTWEESQDMLRPPSTEKPSVVTVEDLEIEEYEEPPVLGKKSIFTARPSGGQEQWTPCDSCSKWRRLPVDILLPPTWTCMDNVWDQSRSSCSAPDELSPRDLESLLRLSKEFKKQRIVANHSILAEEHKAASLNHGLNDLGGTVATTTKHPRHRPGCSCIVCIQPPSGKGKHKPNCTCNVCMTVKRRFKTLMMRKKKRQSEREAEIAHINQNVWGTRDESEVDSTTKEVHISQQCHAEKTNILATKLAELPGNGKGKLDLNSNPDRKEKSSHQDPSHVSMTSLVQVASQPLENYLKQNGLTSLVSEQQGSSGSHSLPLATGEEECKNDNDLDDRTSNGP